MKVLRSIAAVVGGYLALAIPIVLINVTCAALGESILTWVNLATALPAAAIGGFVCCRLAPSHPAGHALALAILFPALAMVSGSDNQGRALPTWYTTALPVLGFCGVLVGAALYRARLRPRAA